jgi:hypothetical protein
MADATWTSMKRGGGLDPKEHAEFSKKEKRENTKKNTEANLFEKTDS